MEHLRIFFSKRVMLDLKDNESRAAIKAWTQSVIKETGIQADAVSEIGSVAEAIGAFCEGRADAASLSADEFFELERAVKVSHIFYPMSSSGPFEEYLLLVHTNSDITNLAQLRGRKLVIHNHHRMSLAEMWLETTLARESLPPTERFFVDVRRVTKAVNVVLPVFFRSTDACLISRRGLELMTELNPQVGKQVRVLRTSPKIVPTLFCFNANSRSEISRRARDAVSVLHRSVFGQQILTTFQVEQITEGNMETLESTRALVRDHAERCAAQHEGNNKTSTPILGARISP